MISTFWGLASNQMNFMVSPKGCWRLPTVHTSTNPLLEYNAQCSNSISFVGYFFETRFGFLSQNRLSMISFL